VAVDVEYYDGGYHPDQQARHFEWDDEGIKSWKPSRDPLLAKFKEQGANEMYTAENTAAATAVKIWPGANPEAPYILKFFNFSGDNSLWLNNGKWEKFFTPLGEPNDDSINFLHRPAHEQEVAHTDGQGVVTYAFSYALDHLTKKATHYNKDSCLFHRLTDGKDSEFLHMPAGTWEPSYITNLCLKVSDRFYALNGDFANRSDEVATVDGKRVDHEKAQQVVNTDLHTPAMVDAVGSWCVSKFDAVADEDKPIFTQEMYDAGELPPIGSKVLFDSQKVTIVGATTKFMPIFELPNGYVDSFNSKSSYRPIDNRSDSQKLVDDILFYLHDDGVKSYRDAVEKALGKFTITLNKE
jgi:hypothetical protein